MKGILFYVGIYAIAMAFVESAVVVYLREIYYPGGFRFPLQAISGHIAITEVIREFATIVMLLLIAILASRRKAEITAWFIYAFAVWDIFYYIFLKLILDWPSSFFDWDILFLIPTTWTGPVLAPIINSATMIILALMIISFSYRGSNISLRGTEWLMVITGCVITVISYILDYTTFMLERFSFNEIFFSPGNADIMMFASTYIPERFNWYLFFLGEGMFLLMMVRYFIRMQRQLT